MNSIEDYQKVFEAQDKSDLFEVNKPFIERMIQTKKTIDELSKGQLIFVHPEHRTKQKVSEHAKLLLRFEQLYKDQTVALNKILGNSAPSDDNPFDDEDGLD